MGAGSEEDILGGDTAVFEVIGRVPAQDDHADRAVGNELSIIRVVTVFPSIPGLVITTNSLGCNLTAVAASRPQSTVSSWIFLGTAKTGTKLRVDFV